MEQKIEKIFFVFQVIAFELGVANSRSLYMASPINVLRNTPKISVKTREDIFQINFSETNEKIMIKALSWRFRK